VVRFALENRRAAEHRQAEDTRHDSMMNTNKGVRRW
jgi:hypothetical protein